MTFEKLHWRSGREGCLFHKYDRHTLPVGWYKASPYAACSNTALYIIVYTRLLSLPSHDICHSLSLKKKPSDRNIDQKHVQWMQAETNPHFSTFPPETPSYGAHFLSFFWRPWALKPRPNSEAQGSKNASLPLVFQLGKRFLSGRLLLPPTGETATALGGGGFQEPYWKRNRRED